MVQGKPSAVMVVGGGVAGIQAALDLANRGLHVYLVEKSPSIGGHMAQLDKTFPTMDCSICILAPKMVECGRHPNITIITDAEVVGLKGRAGDFRVRVLVRPRYVDLERCTGCGICTEKCPMRPPLRRIPDEFNVGLGERRAIYIPFPQAVPRAAIVDPEHCLYLRKNKCLLCEEFCQAEAVDFSQQPRELELHVGAIVIATGFEFLDASIVAEYGYGRYKNVLTSLELERLVCASGPTGGELVRPSDGKKPERIAFIQCVGSRSTRPGHAPYCSAVCCMYATKEAILIKEHEPECEVTIFYMDLRAFGKGFQELVARAKEEYGIRYVRARPSRLIEDPGTGDVIVRYEDTEALELREERFDLVVLCPALVPCRDNVKLAKALGLELDEHGFFRILDPLLAPVDTNVPGIFVCGYCAGPKDISESVYQASCAAERAMEVVFGREVGG